MLLPIRQTSEASAGKQTPPPMLRVRCLGWTRKETSKEAKLHGRQCPLHASLRVTSFRGLSLDASQTWFRLLFFTLPRGKSSARHRGGFTHPSAERTHYTKTAALKSSATVPKISNGQSDTYNSNRNSVFVYRVAWKVNSLVPDYTCSA